MSLIQPVTSFDSEHNTICEYKIFMKTITIKFLRTLPEGKKEM